METSGVVLCDALLVFFFAGERLGARIWVKLFGVAMQPFEFVKISYKIQKIVKERTVL